MTTFGEVIYAVLDLLKERSDDAYYTEEHVAFILSKMRNLLLERKYTGSRNATFKPVSDENKQELCIKVEPVGAEDVLCDANWLKSSVKIPSTISSVIPSVYAIGDMFHSIVEYIPIERLPYVGYNKWLKNIIYAAKSTDGYLYLKSGNGQYLYLEEVKMSGVFSDPIEVANLACCDGSTKCDILSVVFPLESSLIPQCIELTLQELLGSRYAPEDKANNAKDDLSDFATNERGRMPATTSSTPRERREEEEQQQ